MGNLYTQIVRIPNKRLLILQQLKFAYGNTPRDWGLINSLKEELRLIESAKKSKDTKVFRKKVKRQKPLYY